MDSQIEYFTQEMETRTLKSLEKRLIESSLKFNEKAKNFKFDYEIKNNYIFCLLTCETGSEIMPIMYRMLTVYAYSPTTEIYFNGNVGSGYTIQDVKTKTKNYINHVQNELTKI